MSCEIPTKVFDFVGSSHFNNKGYFLRCACSARDHSFQRGAASVSAGSFAQELYDKSLLFQ